MLHVSVGKKCEPLLYFYEGKIHCTCSAVEVQNRCSCIVKIRSKFSILAHHSRGEPYAIRCDANYHADLKALAQRNSVAATFSKPIRPAPA